MSIEQNRNTAVKFYERIAARQFNQLAELCTDDFVYYPDLHTEPLNLQGFIDMESANMSPTNEYDMQLKFTIAEANRVACYLTLDGIMQRDVYLGHEAKKGNRIYMDFMTMLKFRDGKICEKRAKYNMVDVFQQAGCKLFD